MFKRGFTLIELLIVVAIIAILAAIAVPNFLEAQVRSKVSRCKADMRTMVTAIESYSIDHNRYPVAHDRAPYGTASVFHVRTPSTLTTPIAYVTSLVHDPFVNQSNPQTPFTGFPAHELKRYTFFNSKYMDANFGNSWNMGAAGLEGWVGGWLMYGFGPDRVALQGTGRTFLPYDPTNGTVSVGNIVRTHRMTDGIPSHPVSKTFNWNTGQES